MVRINKKITDKKLESRAWNLAFTHAMHTRSAAQFQQFLKQYMSPTEYSVMEKRLLASQLLSEGKGFKEICRTLDMSPTALSFLKHNFIRSRSEKRNKTQMKEPKRKPILPSYKGVHPIF